MDHRKRYNSAAKKKNHSFTISSSLWLISSTLLLCRMRTNTSGYPGVRRHGRDGWQAKDKNGTYGTYRTRYEAACALADAQGKPWPQRVEEETPVTAACSPSADSAAAAALVDAFRTAVAAAPTSTLIAALTAAMTVMSSSSNSGEPPASPATSANPASPSPAQITTNPTATVQQDASSPQSATLTSVARKVNPATAAFQHRISEWWRLVWSRGETFQLGTVRTRVFYDAYRQMTKDTDQLAVATFNKLLIGCMNKPPNSTQVRDRDIGPMRCWEIDQSFCPEDLRETRSAQLQARQEREREARRIKEEEQCRHVTG